VKTEYDSVVVEPGRAHEEVVLTRVVRLNAVLTGIVTGVFAALIIFVATNWLVIKGGRVVGPHLVLLSQFFIGYRVTFLGSLIGAAYALLGGFLIGFFVAAVYNWFADLRQPKQAH